MDELIERIERKVGLAPETARKSIAAILTYLDKNGPQDRMSELYEAVPGARELVGKRRGLFGVFGGGLAGVYSQLTQAGLSAEKMQMAGEEVLAFARERIGAEAVDEIIAATPGLRQLL